MSRHTLRYHIQHSSVIMGLLVLLLSNMEIYVSIATPLHAHATTTTAVRDDSQVHAVLGLRQYPGSSPDLDFAAQARLLDAGFYKVGSPSYQHFLSPTGYSQQFSLEKVRSFVFRWLGEQKNKISYLKQYDYPGRPFIDIMGSVKTFRDQLNIIFSRETRTDGVTLGFAHLPSSETEDPARLWHYSYGVIAASLISPSVSDHMYAPVPAQKGKPAKIAVHPCGDDASRFGVAPRTIASAYHLTDLPTHGVSSPLAQVAIIEQGGFSMDNINQYMSCYRPSENIRTEITPVAIDASVTASVPSAFFPVDDHQEGVLETLVGVMPTLAHVAVYQVRRGSDLELFHAVEQAIRDNVPVVSITWADCEADTSHGWMPGLHQLFVEGAFQGESILAGSGNSGSTGCGHNQNTDSHLSVDYPASDPYVTAVGGTVLQLGDNLRIREPAWKNSGGGLSTIWQIPSWQVLYRKQVGVPVTVQRMVPDIAMNAVDYPVYCAADVGKCPSKWKQVSGTSFSTPVAATLAVLVDVTAGRRVGTLSPYLYQLGLDAFEDTYTEENCQPLTNDLLTNDLYNPPRRMYTVKHLYNLVTGLGAPKDAARIARLIAM